MEKRVSEEQWPVKRRRRIALALAAFLALIMLAVVSVAIFLQSNTFRQLAIRKIIKSAEQATGSKTEIQNFDFTLSTLTAHLYGVTMHGAESVGRPPLLQIDQLTVTLKILSFFKREIGLSELVITHPVVHFQIDRNGKNNLPQAATAQPSSSGGVFDMAVRHVLLTDGVIFYNDLQTPVDADLYDLGANIHSDFFSSRYTGSISYDNGHLRYAKYAPLTHGLQLDFSATPASLSLEPAVLKIGSSTATLHINVGNYSHPDVSGTYNILVHTQDFASMAPGAAPAGDIILAGKLSCPNCSAQPIARALALEGEISSEVLSAAASNGRIEARKLHAVYRMSNGSLQADNIELQSLAGNVRGNLDIQHLDATPSTRIRTSFRNISLQAAQNALREPQLRRVALLGTLDGTSEASWTGSPQNLRLTSDLTLRAAAARQTIRPSITPIPVDGAVHLTYDNRRNTLALRSSTLRIPSAAITAQGEISDHSNLQIQTTASDLHQLAALALAFRPNLPTPVVSGSATLNATIHGSLKKPDIVGELSAQNLKVQGGEWRSAHANLAATPAQVTITKGSLVSAKRGSASFSGVVALRDWSYQPADPIKLNLSVHQMSVADLERLANQTYPINGDLSAEIILTGSQLDPAGSGSVEISKGNAYGEPIQTVALKFRMDSGSIKSSLNVALPAGPVNADISFTPRTKAFSLRLDAPKLDLRKLHTVEEKNLPLNGILSASAKGSGTLDDPQISAVIQLPKLTVRDQSISDLKAQLDVANRKAAFNLTSQIVNASVRAHGNIELTGDYYTEATVDTSSVPIEVLLAAYVPNLPDGFKGQTELHAMLKGPLKNRALLQAHLTIPVLNATYTSLQIGAAGPIQADYANSVLTIQPAEIRGTGTSLRVQGSVPFGNDSPPSLAAKGTIDVRILQAFSPDIQSSGTISLDVHSGGTMQAPTMNGQVKLQDVAMLQPGAALGIEKLNGTIAIDPDRIYLQSLTGQVGGGNLSMGGSITYRPSLQFNVALQGESIRLRYPDGLRTLLDTNLNLTGTRDSSILNGHVLIDSLSFTSDFDLAKFSDQFSGNSAIPTAKGFADTVRLAVAVQSQQDLSATSSQVSVEGRVNLRVVGTAADPVLTGRADLTSGELFYRNVRYQLQRGIITFDDPNQTNPVLNIAVSSTVEQYNLTLNLRGPIDKLTTSYVADPPLATADIINLLATGQTTQESAASQSTDSILASQAAGQFSGSVQRLAGLSSLQIDPLVGGSNQNPSARIAVQQRVTKNFLFTFSTDVSQPGSEIVQGDYRISRRWSLSVARQESGGVSAEGKFHKKF